jgi:hypothetical protein
MVICDDRSICWLLLPHRMDEQRRREEDKYDSLPEEWNDANFFLDGDPRSLVRAKPAKAGAPPPAYRQKRVGLRSTRAQYAKHLPVYRVPQRTFLNHFKKQALLDTEGRHYYPIGARLPDGKTVDEAFAFFQDARHVALQQCFYVVLTPNQEFPLEDSITVGGQRYRVVFADCPRTRAVGILVVAPAGITR